MSTQAVHKSPHAYAVVWRTGDGPTSSGRLELGQEEVVLHGTDRTRLTIPFADLASVEIGRGTSDRINGDKSLVLERHFCERVFVSGREVVFFFEGDSAATVVEALSRNPGVLKAAARWRGILAGRPRLAEEQFAWTRAN